MEDFVNHHQKSMFVKFLFIAFHLYAGIKNNRLFLKQPAGDAF